MRKIFVTLASALTCVIGASAASAAAPAVATTNVNLRAGPSTHFPVVSVVPAGAALVTLGCLPGYTWCDVNFAGTRGWLAARYIRLAGPGVVITPAAAAPLGIAVVAFNEAYWRTHYAARPWVGRWPAYAARWRSPGVAPYRGPVRFGVRAGCLGAGCSGSRTITGPAGRSATRSFSVHP